MSNDSIEILTVTNASGSYPTCYSARTGGDIEGAVIDAIHELDLDVPTETIKEMVHDLKKESLYWLDDYAFEVYDI